MQSRIPDALTCGSTTLSTSAGQITTLPVDSAEMFVQSDPDNTVDIFLGNATSQPIQLQPGCGDACAGLQLRQHNLRPFQYNCCVVTNSP